MKGDGKVFLYRHFWCGTSNRPTILNSNLTFKVFIKLYFSNWREVIFFNTFAFFRLMFGDIRMDLGAVKNNPVFGWK